jgi:hypothetical protein
MREREARLKGKPASEPALSLSLLFFSDEIGGGFFLITMRDT